MGLSKLVKTIVICAGLYLCIAPATFVIQNSINNIVTNNGTRNINRII